MMRSDRNVVCTEFSTYILPFSSYGRLKRKIALGIIKKRFFKNVIDNSKTEILTVEQKIDKFLNVHLNLSLRHC